MDACIPTAIGDGSIMIVHKVLKENDRMKSEVAARRSGIDRENFDPLIAINLDTVVSVQEDFCNLGTIIIDTNKSITLVKESFQSIMDCWADYKTGGRQE